MGLADSQSQHHGTEYRIWSQETQISFTQHLLLPKAHILTKNATIKSFRCYAFLLKHNKYRKTITYISNIHFLKCKSKNQNLVKELVLYAYIIRGEPFTDFSQWCNGRKFISFVENKSRECLLRILLICVSATPNEHNIFTCHLLT